MGVRVGLVGLGPKGHGYGHSETGEPLSHSAAYAQVPGADLVLGVDPNPNYREAFSKVFPSAMTYAQVSQVPENMHLDVLSLATAPGVSGRIIRQSLELTPRVLVLDQDLGLGPAQMRQLQRTIESYNSEAQTPTQVLLNHGRRWTPFFDKLQEVFASPQIGVPRHSTVRVSGGLDDSATHHIDLFMALLGAPARVWGFGSGRTFGSDKPGGLNVCWPSGFQLQVTCLPWLDASVSEGEVWGDHGVLRFREGGGRVELSLFSDGAWPGVRVTTAPRVVLRNGLSGHILRPLTEATQLARNVRRAKRPRCGIDDAVALADVLNAAGAFGDVLESFGVDEPDYIGSESTNSPFRAA